MGKEERLLKRFIEEELDITALFESGGAYHLSDIVERCFLQTSNARTILTCLFSSLVPTFDFNHLLAKISSSNERKTFLTFLLHHLLSRNFSLQAFVSKTACSSYLIQQLAPLVKEVTLTKLWHGLSLTDKIKTLGFCYKNYEEGTFFLSQIARKNPIFKKFCDYIDRGLIDRAALFDWAANYSSLSKSQFALFFAQQKREIKTKISQMHSELENQYSVQISVAKLSKFVSIFGLYGFQLPAEEASPNQQLLNYLHAFQEHPKVDKLVLAMPTRSRELEKLPWLSSMLSCLSLLLHYQNRPDMAMKDYPIFVFDQSEPKIFQKNSTYIKKLNTLHKASIIHLGSKELISLAKKLSIEKMVVTAPDGHFGYGGARNAIFLIAPVLHALFQKHGPACIAKALSTPEKELHMLFKQVICSENALTVHMGEDDLWEPPATLIADSLFAHYNKNDYFFRMGSCIGRETTQVHGSFDIGSLLYDCRSVYAQFAWSEKQTLTGMRAALTKPKICLNLPCGNEEAHLQPQKTTIFDYRRCAYHLSGWRYPTGEIPTSRFTGITHFLRAHNPYVLGLQLTEELLRPIEYSTTPLVWNRHQEPFSSLQEAIDYIVDEKITKSMQEQFWRNLEEYLSEQRVTTATVLQDLIDLDIEKEFLDQRLLDPTTCLYEKELQNLKSYIKELVQQAKEYKEFAMTVLAEMKKGKNPKIAIDLAKMAVEKNYQRPIESMPFAHTLYLVCLSVGAGGFQEALRGCFPKALIPHA
ncbi:MAG: hypothetical protein JSR46_01905 [Verrucomicrobia bacterium]|nr:hypothetical protein [Verrucomicrobiota bacterium]